MFYAAAIMLQNHMLIGRGDFLKVIKTLQVKNSAEFKDIANKLVLIKTGHLYRKGC